MKKKVFKTIEETVEVTVEDIADEIIESYELCDLADIIRDDDIIECIDDYLNEEDMEIANSEKETIKNLIISKVTPQIEKLKKKELEIFSNRNRILKEMENWLADSDANCYYVITVEDILDEIIKNGNK